MKFLDQNGVLTLWNKIKDNFPAYTILPTGDKCLSVGPSRWWMVPWFVEKQIGGELLCGSNIFPSGSAQSAMYSFLITLAVNHESTFVGTYTQLSPGAISLSQGADSANYNYASIKYSASIAASGLRLVNATGDTVQITASQDSTNEYAKPIQDLESILV